MRLHDGTALTDMGSSRHIGWSSEADGWLRSLLAIETQVSALIAILKLFSFFYLADYLQNLFCEEFRLKL